MVALYNIFEMGNILQFVIFMSAFSIPISVTHQASNSEPNLTSNNPIYYDWTDLINTFLKNGEGDLARHLAKVDASRSHIFYSTDLFASNLTAGLAPVFDLLDKTKLTTNPIYISFPIMDGELLSGDRFGDLLSATDVLSSAPLEQKESFVKHVSGIFLDLTSADCPYGNLTVGTSIIDYQSQCHSEYDTEWDISFIKYIKNIFRKLYENTGKSLKVGVIYDEKQLYCFQIVQQIKHADLIMINVTFSPERKFPLSYRKFASYLEEIASYDKKYFLNGIIPDVSKVNITFKVNLVPTSFDDIDYLFANSTTNETAAVNGILKKYQHAFFPQLLQFAGEWAKEGKPELIVGQDMNMGSTWEKSGTDGGTEDKAIPREAYLHVQEVDVTPCQLKTMLGQAASQFTSLVLSEYTWSTFAHYADNMTENYCPKSSNFPANPPNNIGLLFTSGVGKFWGKAEPHFRKLLQAPKDIHGWRLDHLIFPGRDAGGLICERWDDDCGSENETKSVDSTIPKFAMEMKDKYKIGCLVELSYPLMYTELVNKSQSTVDLFRNITMQSCNGVWNLTSLIIWQFKEEWKVYHRSYRMQGDLIKALMARESLALDFPEKEIIFKIDVLNIYSIPVWKRDTLKIYSKREEYCQELFNDLHDVYEGFNNWGRIHKVRVIATPAYHVQEAIKGLWTLPEEDGSPTKYNKDVCTKTIDRYINQFN